MSGSHQSDAKKIRIVVADDHALVREGIVSLLRSCPDFDVVAEAEDGEAAVLLCRALRPDLLLLDLRMPKLDGVAVIARLRKDATDTRYIVLSTYDNGEDVHRALNVGTHGYVLKGIKYADLVGVIRDVVERRLRRVPMELVDRALGASYDPELTARELDVLKLLAAGRSNAEIGAQLAITEATVKNHVTNVLAKLGVTSRTQATVVALQRGLVSLD
jgi:DNA-binding NarL/FixJ family response regulator